MKTERGNTRSVMIVGMVVLKFPRLKDFWENVKINWNEFFVYIIYRPSLCAPTYFSFFGLCNVQLKGVETTDETFFVNQIAVQKMAHIYKLMRLFANEKKLNLLQESKLNHAMCSYHNLFWFKGEIKNVDYGDPIVLDFLNYIKTLS